MGSLRLIRLRYWLDDSLIRYTIGQCSLFILHNAHLDFTLLHLSLDWPEISYPILGNYYYLEAFAESSGPCSP
jgi:hypothetical protein